MALDSTSSVGTVAAELMELLAEEHADHPQARLGTVMVIAEVNFYEDQKEEEDEGPGCTVIRYRCSDSRAWVQGGILQAALHATMKDD